MKTNEWAGVGNHTTALYWEYDPRTGRRHNIDPQFKKTPGLSPYATNNNNPIQCNDPNGDFAHILAGAAIGFVGSLVKSLIVDGTKAFDKDHIGKTFKKAGVNALTGAVVAGTGGAGVGLLTTMGVAGGANFIGSVAEDNIDGVNVDYAKAGRAALWGIIGQGIGGVVKADPLLKNLGENKGLIIDRALETLDVFGGAAIDKISAEQAANQTAYNIDSRSRWLDPVQVSGARIVPSALKSLWKTIKNAAYKKHHDLYE